MALAVARTIVSLVTLIKSGLFLSRSGLPSPMKVKSFSSVPRCNRYGG